MCLWSVPPIVPPIASPIGESPAPKSDECITDLDQTGAVLYILEGVGLRSVILWSTFKGSGVPEPGIPGVSREHQNGVLQAVPRGVF